MWPDLIQALASDLRTKQKSENMRCWAVQIKLGPEVNLKIDLKKFPLLHLNIPVPVWAEGSALLWKSAPPESRVGRETGVRVLPRLCQPPHQLRRHGLEAYPTWPLCFKNKKENLLCNCIINSVYISTHQRNQPIASPTVAPGKEKHNPCHCFSMRNPSQRSTQHRRNEDTAC